MCSSDLPDAVLLADKDGRYYIGTLTTASLDSAVSALHSLSESSPVALRTPKPNNLKTPSHILSTSLL